MRIGILLLLSAPLFAQFSNPWLVNGRSVSLRPGLTNVTIGATVLASPTCDGSTDDRATIQAALDSGAAHVVVSKAGTCIISGYLKVYSNQWLELSPQTTIQFAASVTAGNMLVNRAFVTVQRSVADAVTTATSTTLTSATAAFTSADVGRSVVIPGALAVGLEPFCATITVVTNGTTVTLDTAASVSVSGATLSIYARDSNIRVTGGTWARGAVGGTGTTDLHTLVFRHVDGLTLSDMKVTTGTGAKYAISAADYTNFNAQRINFSTYSDGIHVCGPAVGTVIRDITGTTNDDSVAFTSIDWGTYCDVAGNISNVLVDNVGSSTTKSAVKILGGTNTNLRNITLRNLFPVTATNAVSVANESQTGSATDVGGLLIDGFGGGAATYITLNAATGRDATIRNFHPFSAVTGVVVTGSWEGITLDGVSQLSTNTSASPVVQVNASTTVGSLIANNWQLAGSATNYPIMVFGAITNLIMNNWQVDASAGGAAPLNVVSGGSVTNALIANLRGTWGGSSTSQVITVGGTLSNLYLSNANLTFQDANTSNVVVVNANATLGRYVLSNIYQYKGKSLFYFGGGTVGAGQVLGSYFDHVNRIGNVYVNADVLLSGVLVDTPTNALIYVSGAAATVRGSGFRQVAGSAKDGFQRGASEVVHCLNTDYPTDISILTRAAGDKCYNTNAALGTLAAAGPVIADGTAWHLWSNPALVY